MSDRLPSFYTKLYSNEKHDSPDRSRSSLIRRVSGVLRSGIPGNNILNIGSGPQSLEKQMWSSGDKNLLRNFNFSTIDVAKIHSKKLLVKGRSNISHSQASALDLPYENESFGLVISNHAIDFLPRDAFKEAFRVLKPKGVALFYFHHPDMIDIDLEKIPNEDIREFWKYLRESNHLFDSTERIESEMKGFGFSITSININSDSQDRWWEVELQKPD